MTKPRTTARRALTAVWMAVVVLVACYGLRLLARDGGMGRVMEIVLAADGSAGVLAYLLFGPSTLADGGSSRAGGPFAVALPLVLVEALVGFALYPATASSDPRPGGMWFPGVLFVVGAGLFAAVLVFVGCVLVVTPLRMVAGGLRDRSGDRWATVLTGLALLWIVPLGVALALGTGTGSRGVGSLIGHLLGLVPDARPGYMWLARALALAMVGTLVAAVLARRRQGLRGDD